MVSLKKTQIQVHITLTTHLLLTVQCHLVGIMNKFRNAVHNIAWFVKSDAESGDWQSLFDEFQFPGPPFK